MSEILVIGHRNPDTDSICAAVAYADFKHRTGLRNVVAARCGEVNERTQFVLRSFNVPAPMFVADVSPKVRDVMQSTVISVPPRTTAVEALAVMDDRNIRVLPVLDHDRRCRGLLSVFKASKFLFPSPNRIFDSRRVVASIRSLARTLNAKMVCASEPDREEELILMVGAMNAPSFASRLPNYAPEKILVVVGDREDIQRLAVDGRVRAIVVTGGLDISPEIRELANRNEVTLLLCPHDSATTAMLCRAAISVDHVLRQDFLTFRADERLREVQAIAAESTFQAFPVLDDDDRVVGMLSKSDFLKKVDRRLILVDHNELSQAVHGADQVEIIEIIDHHRIGAFSTSQPILFRNEPVGSTSTIIADLYSRQGVPLTPGIAGLLLAGVVSDTLNLTSPTTTKRDAEILPWLEQKAEVKAAEFTEQLFSSGSVLVSQPPDRAITADCKEYVEAGRRFSVAQIEELGFDVFWKRHAEIRGALEQYRATNGYVFSALFVTDVAAQSSLLLVAGPAKLIGAIKYPEAAPGVFQLAEIVSRKKQLLPYLTETLNHVVSAGLL
jgi:manganese-dependent inorganic pyrophosphatase